MNYTIPKYLFCMFFVFTLFVGIGCNKDNSQERVEPSISFINEPGYMYEDGELTSGEDLKVKVLIEKGQEALKLITLKIGEEVLDPGKFTIDGVTVANPHIITNSESVTYEIVIETDNLPGDIQTYYFEATDNSSQVGKASLTVTTTTPLNIHYTDLLLNNLAAGTSNRLDLDTGSTFDTNNENVDLRDRGLIAGEPSAHNWYQQIIPQNGTKIRHPDFSQVDNFNFDETLSREYLMTLWDTSTNLEFTVSLNINNYFMVLVDEDYYLIRVNDIYVNGQGNDDHYILEVKGSQK